MRGVRQRSDSPWALCCFLPATICSYPFVPSENTEQRKLAAIMFTDMVGYSALSQRNEALALELLAENQRLLRTQFPLFNGREVKTTGDGFLVEFPSALQATQCAVEIQRAVVARNSTQPGERHIHVRIGIHVGDVVHREADMYGDGVNIAARSPVEKSGPRQMSVRRNQRNLRGSALPGL